MRRSLSEDLFKCSRVSREVRRENDDVFLPKPGDLRERTKHLVVDHLGGTSWRRNSMQGERTITPSARGIRHARFVALHRPLDFAQDSESFTNHAAACRLGVYHFGVVERVNDDRRFCSKRRERCHERVAFIADLPFTKHFAACAFAYRNPCDLATGYATLLKLHGWHEHVHTHRTVLRERRQESHGQRRHR